MSSTSLWTNGLAWDYNAMLEPPTYRLQHVTECLGLQILKYISQVNTLCEELIAAATNMDEATAVSGKRPRNA